MKIEKLQKIQLQFHLNQILDTFQDRKISLLKTTFIQNKFNLFQKK